MLRDERYRGLVVDVLAAVGPAARDAVPELTRLLRGPAIPGEREQCLEALTAIGQDAKAAVPEIIRIVGDESLFPSSLQWAAYRAIEAIGPAAEEAVPTILAALRKNPSLGWAAASAFRAMGAAAAEAVDDLVMVLRRADRTYADRPGPRQLACEALGRIGLPAARVVPALVVATHDRESAVRHAAREALQRIRRE
jgi:HEAT repeat protein